MTRKISQLAYCKEVSNINRFYLTGVKKLKQLTSAYILSPRDSGYNEG